MLHAPAPATAMNTRISTATMTTTTVTTLPFAGQPVAGKKLWDVPSKAPFWAGVASTAGGVIFTGAQTGEFMAFDAASGKKLWQFQTGSGITGLPIVWEHKGKQYVTITSGSATVYAALAGDPELTNIVPGSSLWTFALRD